MNELGLEVFRDKEIVVSSLQVAEVFEKDHKNVLQSIENLTAKNQAVKEWFFESSYRNERNREYPMYLMNSKGFTVLAVGFTGDKATDFKVKYINAFEEMEQRIKSQANQPLTTSGAIQALAVGHVELEERLIKLEEENPIFPGQAAALRTEIGYKVAEIVKNKFSHDVDDEDMKVIRRKLFSGLYRSLKRAFVTSNYQSIRRKDFEEALFSSRLLRRVAT